MFVPFPLPLPLVLALLSPVDVDAANALVPFPSTVPLPICALDTEADSEDVLGALVGDELVVVMRSDDPVVAFGDFEAEIEPVGKGDAEGEGEAESTALSPPSDCSVKGPE